MAAAFAAAASIDGGLAGRTATRAPSRALRRQIAEHAGAGAEVDQRPGGLARVGQLAAATPGRAWWSRGRRCRRPGRGRRRRSHRSRRSAPARSLPGGPQPEPPAADRDGTWKSRQRSAQSSGISVELTSTRPSPAAASRSGELRQLARRRRRSRTRLAVGSSSSPSGAGSGRPDLRLPGASGRRAGRATHAAHASSRPARGPSPRGPGCRRRASRRARSASSRCSSLRLRGTTTLKITCWLPRLRLRSAGKPSPSSTVRWPGWAPARPRSRARRRASATVRLRPEHRLRRGDSTMRDEVVAVALEALVLGDRDLDVEVAGAAPRARPRGRRRRSGSAGRPRSRPGSRPPCVAARRRSRPLPPQTSQGCLGDLAGAAADVAGPVLRTICPKAVRVTCRSWPAPPQRLAGGDRRPRLGAVAVAVLAGGDRVEARPRGGPRWRPRRARSRPATPMSPPAAGPPPPKPKCRERGRRRRRPGRCRRSSRSRAPASKPPRAQALVAVGVVGAAPLGVGEDLVGLGRLLELLLGLGVVVVDVGVQLAGEPAEGLLDLGLVGAAARRRGPRSSRGASARQPS